MTRTIIQGDRIVDLPDWQPYFAWRPVTTLSKERIWCKKIYRRMRRSRKLVEKDRHGFFMQGTYYEYATLLDVLSSKYEIKLPEPGSLASFVMPMIRNVMPNIIAHEICGVQPMQDSTGQIFNVKTHYGFRSRVRHAIRKAFFKIIRH